MSEEQAATTVSEVVAAEEEKSKRKTKFYALVQTESGEKDLVVACTRAELKKALAHCCIQHVCLIVRGVELPVRAETKLSF